MPKRNSSSGSWLVSGLAWGLAAGIVVGTLVVAPAMAPISDNEFTNIDGPSEGERPKQKDKRNGDRDGEADGEEEPGINRESAAANALLAQTSTALVDGALTGRSFMVVRAPDANADDVEVTRWLAEAAGGMLAGEIALTDKFLSQDGADELRSIIANTLPAGAQLSVDNQTPGIHAGESLGAALMFAPNTESPLATVEDRDVVLQALRDAGFIEYTDGTITPAHGIILITGGAEQEDEVGQPSDADGFAATVLADFARGLDSRGDAVVLAGRRGAAAGDGSLAQIRSDSESNEVISTVDSLESETGRISAVLALAEQIAGEAGSYGSASNAQVPAPERPQQG